MTIATMPRTLPSIFFYFTAQESATEVRVLYGSYQYEFHGALLDAGQWHDFDISSTDSVHIVSNHPILVAQIAKSYDTDGNRQSDPMINLVVPYQQYTGRATFTTILAHNGDEFSNYLGIVIPSVYQVKFSAGVPVSCLHMRQMVHDYKRVRVHDYS